MSGIEFVKYIETALIQNDIPKELFYSKSGISTASMSQWRSGKFDPSQKAIEKVKTFFEQQSGSKIAEKEPATSGDELSEEEVQFIKWFRTQASEKDKAIVRAIVEAEDK